MIYGWFVKRVVNRDNTLESGVNSATSELIPRSQKRENKMFYPIPSILPPIPLGLRTAYFGDSGGATDRYYWVRANYSGGQSNFAGPVKVTTPASLSKNNIVLLTWSPMPQAISYDIVQTTTNVRPTVAASVGLAVGWDHNSYVDDGTVTLFSYTPFASARGGIGGLQTFKAKYDFTVDGGAQGLITPVATILIPKNTILVGGTINSTVAVTSLGSATLAVGTSAGSAANSILAATAKATLSLDAMVNSAITFAAPVKMSADGNVTVTVATADLTAGVVEISVFGYLPTELA